MWVNFNKCSRPVLSTAFTLADPTNCGSEKPFSHSQLRFPNHRSKTLFLICRWLNPRWEEPTVESSYTCIFSCAGGRTPMLCKDQICC